MLQVVTVNADELETFEQLGSKDKFWYDERKYLFKARRSKTGEDWAEVIAAQLADRLGLPHARYDLAQAINLPAAEPGEAEREPRGVRSLNFTPPDGRLVVGNELIGPLQVIRQLGRSRRLRGGNFTRPLAFIPYWYG